ncbi:DMT family transporter [Psychromonas algarum]|uniref:DMT family transporter n=1 Tax=Psychromonas algarum TaxID=2555643 RepID=UPI001FB93C80|nr:DMT family transporter [Psychromonas sp. RZ22]
MFNKTFALTIFALFAFAANSVFCRLALGGDQIDAGSFTVIRLFSGSLFLASLLFFKHYYLTPKNENKKREATSRNGSWLNALWLFIYALTFSYAYIQLDTATGALVLFATVQVTMLIIGLCKGRSLSIAEWSGLLLAIVGFVYLLAPQISSPSLIAFILMCVSGISWAFYTLAGKQSTDPSADTIYNFLRTLPFVFILMLINIESSHLSLVGVINAVLSGVFASALGYLLWYQALKGLRHNVAAVVQLLVPVFAAIAGFILLDERVSITFLISSLMILSGILLVIKNPTIKFLNKHNKP